MTASDGMRLSCSSGGKGRGTGTAGYGGKGIKGVREQREKALRLLFRYPCYPFIPTTPASRMSGYPDYPAYSLQPIYLSSYVSDCIEQGSRVLVRDRQQRARWAGWGSSFLLPFLQCANGYAEQSCKLDLGQADTRPRLGYRGIREDSPYGSPLEFSEPTENFIPDIASFCLSHRRSPF